MRSGKIEAGGRVNERRIRAHLPGVDGMAVRTRNLDGSMRRDLRRGPLEENAQQNQYAERSHPCVPS